MSILYLSEWAHAIAVVLSVWAVVAVVLALVIGGMTRRRDEQVSKDE